MTSTTTTSDATKNCISCDYCSTPMTNLQEIKPDLMKMLEPYMKAHLNFMWFCNNCIDHVTAVIEHEQALDEEEQEKEEANH